MTAWIESHAAFLGPLAILSAIMFVGSVLALPWLVAQPAVLNALNWLGRRASREPLVVDPVKTR